MIDRLIYGTIDRIGKINIYRVKYLYPDGKIVCINMSRDFPFCRQQTIYMTNETKIKNIYDLFTDDIYNQVCTKRLDNPSYIITLMKHNSARTWTYSNPPDFLLHIHDVLRCFDKYIDEDSDE